MEYLALYRKWRPRGFVDFVGQAHVVRTLRNAVEQNRIAHAYLFCGPRGTGKTTAAKILARAVNCQAPSHGDPCGECPSCKRIAGGISLDVQEIDGASNRGIDEVRDLREKVKFAPAEGRFRVYIIDEVHMLTGEAFNALLKTLEEPPAQVIFIFATTEPHKLPATVLSRCQRFEFKRFAQDEIKEHLKEIAAVEGFTAEEPALDLIAAMAAGGMRDAIGLLEQAAIHAGEIITPAQVREVLGLVDLEVYQRLAEAVRDRNTKAALDILTEIGTEGKDLVQFARGAAGLWRDLLVLAVCRGCACPPSLPGEDLAPWRLIAGEIGAERLLAAVEILTGVANEQRRAGDNRLPLDLALIRITSGIGGAADLAERVTRLEQRLAGGPVDLRPVEKSRKTIDAAPVAQPGALTMGSKPVETGSDRAKPSGGDRDLWPELQARLYKVKPSLSAYLAQFAHPLGIKGHAYILTFDNQDFVAKAESDRALIEKVLTELCGAAISLRCEVGTALRRTDVDPVADTVRIFEGTVEES